jgi:hypothetical protein
VLHTGVRFWLGLAIGLALGVGLGWLVTARPWRGAPDPVAALADAGPEPTKERRRGKSGRRKGRGGEADGDAPAPEVSASGRAMTWRGPDISPPAREMDLGSDDSGRPLDNGEINGVLERSSDPVLACIRDALAGAVLQGEVRLKMLVSGDGKVGQVRVGAPRWLLDHGFADCASAAARRMRFPATGAPTVVDAPYHID